MRPSLDHPGGLVEIVEPATPLPRIEIFGNGFSVLPDLLIAGTPRNDGLTLSFPDGTSRIVTVPGLFAIGRPWLSPDGKFAAVQATETRVEPGSGAPPLFTVYLVDLASGTFRRLGDVPRDPATQSELPVWFPSGDRIAYWTTRDGCLVVKVREVAGAKDALTIARDGTSGCYQPQRGILDGVRFHTAVSADSSKILVPGQMQIYDAKTGALLADVRQQAMAGIAAAGYKPDARFPGQAGGGTFPLDGAFSPDGKQIAFDGAVEKDGTFGVLVCVINVDGTGFRILRGPLSTTPKLSNDHNFSQVSPRWR